MSAKPFANIWNAASLPTPLPGPGVTIVDTTTSSPIATRQAEPANMSEGATGVVPLGHAISPTAASPAKRSPAHYLWAVLIARIYKVFPLLCPK